MPCSCAGSTTNSPQAPRSVHGRPSRGRHTGLAEASQETQSRPSTRAHSSHATRPQRAPAPRVADRSLPRHAADKPSETTNRREHEMRLARRRKREATYLVDTRQVHSSRPAPTRAHNPFCRLAIRCLSSLNVAVKARPRPRRRCGKTAQRRPLDACGTGSLWQGLGSCNSGHANETHTSILLR